MDNSNVSSSGQNDKAQQVQPSAPQPAVQQPVQPVPPPIAEPVAPASPPPSQGGPVGVPNKEFAPASVSTHEVMQPTEVEPQITPEVKEAGVVAVADVPDLTIHDQKAGIQLAKESTPHPTAPTGAVTYPMTEGEAKEVVKHKNVRSAWYWVALAVLKQIHKKILSP